MKALACAVFCALAISLSPVPVAAGSATTLELSSQIYIGPGGVQIGDGHERWRSHRRRGSEDGGHSRRGSERVERERECRQLRRACEYGPRGEGNCRRYRRLCE